MTPEQWGYAVVGGLGPSEREVHLQIVRLVADAIQKAIISERDECAKLAEEYFVYEENDRTPLTIAAAIRARSKEPSRSP